MAFYVEDKGGNFERCPAGLHLARCYRVIDLGTQKSEYMGEIKYLHKIMLGWEMHGQRDDGTQMLMKDGRPYGIFKNYTHSWSDKANLRIDLQSWRGKAFSNEELRRFDLNTILGAWCMLNIIDHVGSNGNTYANVKGITPVPQLIKKNGLPEGVNKTETFNLEEPDMTVFNGFSDYLKKKIEASPEWQKRQDGDVQKTSTEVVDELDDGIPF